MSPPHHPSSLLIYVKKPSFFAAVGEPRWVVSVLLINLSRCSRWAELYFLDTSEGLNGILGNGPGGSLCKVEGAKKCCGARRGNLKRGGSMRHSSRRYTRMNFQLHHVDIKYIKKHS